ncbi:uncharacterized protein LOC117088406 isoform X2 [Trachypithecus francoisi]|uniref:uncharacterized protein LOC117088406 isoform X2 n=1 Tax=Trachypithecus francoisi TaxID=54180 RepID=UPI00141AE0A9|nr:uncharacterized protein LOC117088406 isoform X2 [Trachypithecus francoisi]
MILENDPCAKEKNVYSASIGRNTLVTPRRIVHPVMGLPFTNRCTEERVRRGEGDVKKEAEIGTMGLQAKTRAHSHILKSPALHPLGHEGQGRTGWKPRNLGSVKEISPSALRISLCTSSPGSWWTLVATGVLGAASLWFCWGWIRESRSSPAGTTGATGGSPRAQVTLLMQEESEWFPPSFLGRQQNPTRGSAVFSDS